MKKAGPVKWLIKNSKAQRAKMGVLILSNAFFSALSVVFAFLIKEIIDSATIYQDMNRLISFAVAIILVVVVQFVF